MDKIEVKTCGNSPFRIFNHGEDFCKATKELTEIPYDKDRVIPDFCPLLTSPITIEIKK